MMKLICRPMLIVFVFSLSSSAYAKSAPRCAETIDEKHFTMQGGKLLQRLVPPRNLDCISQEPDSEVVFDGMIHQDGSVRDLNRIKNSFHRNSDACEKEARTFFLYNLYFPPNLNGKSICVRRMFVYGARVPTW